MLKKLAPYIFILLLLLLSLWINKSCNHQDSSAQEQSVTQQKNQTVSSRGLNRNPAHINYSKHALCRMECRSISKQEILEVLKKGTINYKKSSLQKDDCSKKYALEGNSRDGQRIRIIVAPCKEELTIVTCIDLNKEWECNCD